MVSLKVISLYRETSHFFLRLYLPIATGFSRLGLQVPKVGELGLPWTFLAAAGEQSHSVPWVMEP